MIPLINTPSVDVPVPAAAVQPQTAAAPAREYENARLQIRLASGGKPYVTTLPSESSEHPEHRPTDNRTNTSSTQRTTRSRRIPCWPNTRGGRRYGQVLYALPKVCDSCFGFLITKLIDL